MVGSQFLYTECGTRRTLLNSTQIAAIYVDEVDVNSKDATSFHRQFDPPGGKMYTLEILMSYGRPFHYLFNTAAERDAMYDELIAALPPAIAIVNTASDVPRKPKELEAQRLDSEGNRLYTKEEVYCTREEFARAVTQTVEAKEREWMERHQPTPPAPSEKPPRKPYTRKPKP
ncbi:MAG: hypothetical protein ACRYFX_09230 [Janthinobacterium lividum]